MKILFDTLSTDADRQVMFYVSQPVELGFWGGDNADKVEIKALLVDPSDPHFQLKGCDVATAQYVPSPIAEMDYAVCGKEKKLTPDERLIYINRVGWYKAKYIGTGIGSSIVNMEERKQDCECC